MQGVPVGSLNGEILWVGLGTAPVSTVFPGFSPWWLFPDLEIWKMRSSLPLTPSLNNLVISRKVVFRSITLGLIPNLLYFYWICYTMIKSSLRYLVFESFGLFQIDNLPWNHRKVIGHWWKFNVLSLSLNILADQKIVAVGGEISRSKGSLNILFSI